MGDESVSLSEAAGRHLTDPAPVVVLVLSVEDPERAVARLGVPGPLVLPGVGGDGRVVPLPPALARLVPHPAHHHHVALGVDLPVAGLLLPLLPGCDQTDGEDQDDETQ